MIRLIQRRLIIPRGDTGSFSIPFLTTATSSDIAVFTIFDAATRTKIFEKRLGAGGDVLTIEFSHNETVNLKPGTYLWDIKFYKNPQFVKDDYDNDVLINGDEVDSYYAGFKLPICEIRETGDNLINSADSPDAYLTPQQLDIITSALNTVEAAAKEVENTIHYPIIQNNNWYYWDVSEEEYVDSGISAQGPQGEQGATGEQGPKGDTGEQGLKGDTGTTPQLSIGTVSTVNAGNNATATITGTAENPILSFEIPRGEKGDPSFTAPNFSSSEEYEIGDYVWYNNSLYRFKDAHPAGEWNSNHVDSVSLSTEPDVRWGGLLVNNKILFSMDYDNAAIWINGNPILTYGSERYTITTGSYSFANTSGSGQKYFVYDTSDNTIKIINYSNYAPSMIIAFAFWRNLTYLMNSRHAVYPPCQYQVNDVLCPVEVETNYEYLVDTTNLTAVTLDSSFNHTNPITIKKGTNDHYFAEIDTDDYKITSSLAGYVGPNGSTRSDGSTMVNLKPSINDALTDTQYTTIYMMPGVYYFEEEQVINRSINLIGLGDVKIIHSSNGKIATSGASIRVKAPCYIEGIEFIGGSGVIVEYASAAATCFKHCKFNRSNGNGLNARCKTMVVFECEANNNGIDGFNYHQYSSGSTTIAPTGIIEINCSATRNGNATNRSGNASTIHDFGCIIRVNNDYSYSHGGIMTDSNAMSYNFNCRAYGCLEYNADDPEWTNTAFLAGDSATLWLYGCIGGGVDYLIGAHDSSTIYIDRTIRSNRQYKDNNSTITVLT